MYINITIVHSDTKVSNLNMSSIDIEIQWITLKLPKVREILIGNVYRPPQGNLKSF